LRSDLRQRVLELIAHVRTVRLRALLHSDRNKLRVRRIATGSQLCRRTAMYGGSIDCTFPTVT
jgi:hypothetical protein